MHGVPHLQVQLLFTSGVVVVDGWKNREHRLLGIISAQLRVKGEALHYSRFPITTLASILSGWSVQKVDKPREKKARLEAAGVSFIYDQQLQLFAVKPID